MRKKGPSEKRYDIELEEERGGEVPKLEEETHAKFPKREVIGGT